MIYNPQDGAFRTKHGPIFSNLILADEINRAPAKVQSALLEAMQERQVTIGDETYALPNPFLVLATQNPLEQEGTYPLAGSADRPLHDEGHRQLSEPRRRARHPGRHGDHRALPSVRPGRLRRSRSSTRATSSTPSTSTTRSATTSSTWCSRPVRPSPTRSNLDGYIQTGASPRATINLTLAARAIAFLERPRLRHAAGRQEHCARCAAPPRVGDLRGGSRERHLRGRHRTRFSTPCRCLDRA